MVGPSLHCINQASLLTEVTSSPRIQERSVLLTPPTIDGRAAGLKNEVERQNRKAEEQDGEAKHSELWLRLGAQAPTAPKCYPRSQFLFIPLRCLLRPPRM